MKAPSWALGVAIIGLAAPACESRAPDAEAQRRAGIGGHTLDADTGAETGAKEGAQGRTQVGMNVSTSPHTAAPARFDASTDVRARDIERGDANAAAPAAASSDGEQRLVGEERERDPRSDLVRIKVIVDARRQAHVLWGRKDFGVAPLEIQRPRDSGPLDLVVVAPGYLPHHARALTDRDDVVMLRLYAATEAPQLLGYRSSEVPKTPVRDPVKDPWKDPSKKAPKEASGSTPKKK